MFLWEGIKNRPRKYNHLLQYIYGVREEIFDINKEGGERGEIELCFRFTTDSLLRKIFFFRKIIRITFRQVDPGENSQKLKTWKPVSKENSSPTDSSCFKFNGLGPKSRMGQNRQRNLRASNSTSKTSPAKKISSWKRLEWKILRRKLFSSSAELQGFPGNEPGHDISNNMKKFKRMSNLITWFPKVSRFPKQSYISDFY